MRTTPTPWTTKRSDMNNTAIKDANENLVTVVCGEGHEDSAALIVQAVNAHVKLVEALRVRMVECYEDTGFVSCDECDDNPPCLALEVMKLVKSQDQDT